MTLLSPIVIGFAAEVTTGLFEKNGVEGTQRGAIAVASVGVPSGLRSLCLTHTVQQLRQHPSGGERCRRLATVTDPGTGELCARAAVHARPATG
jgi:hypothetical protein